jgi:hypothetical protein
MTSIGAISGTGVGLGAGLPPGPGKVISIGNSKARPMAWRMPA